MYERVVAGRMERIPTELIGIAAGDEVPSRIKEPCTYCKSWQANLESCMLVCS
jgi:hypothetical protein